MRTRFFRNAKYGDLLVIIDDGDKYMFSLPDIQRILELSIGAIVDVKKEGVKIVTKKMLSVDGNDDIEIFIDEKTLCDYINKSNSKTAVDFKEWIHDNVITVLNNENGLRDLLDSSCEVYLLEIEGTGDIYNKCFKAKRFDLISVFSSEEKAINEFGKFVPLFKKIGKDNNLYVSEGEKSLSIEERGYYDNNHLSIYIEKYKVK